MTPENLIKNQVCSWLALKHGFFFQVDSVGIFDFKKRSFRSNRSPWRMRGVADIIGIWKGKPLAIEVKSATGRLSPFQKEFLEKWELAGGISIVARCIEDVEKALKD
jgi:penicillin-binding protein-related factor A (putative recombinase)